MERLFFRPGAEQFAPPTREAGRCDVADKGNNKYLITPDRRKGLVTLIKHQDELQHLQWKDRTTNAIVEDVIVMGDATFTKVDTGRAKDRVYLLQFTGGSSRRFFFWMQSKSDEKDEEHAKKLNKAIQDPGAMEVDAGSAEPTPNVEDLLASMLGGGAAQGAAAGATAGIPPAPARPTTAPAAPAPSSGAARSGGQLTQADLRRAMMNLAQMQTQQQPLNLAEVVNADEVLRSGILSDPAVQEQLVPLLAEGQQRPEELQAVMRSPQLRSTLASLTGALQTENFQAIMSNFGLDMTRGLDAIQQGNNVEAFIQALLALQREPPSGEEKKDEEKQGGASE